MHDTLPSLYLGIQGKVAFGPDSMCQPLRTSRPGRIYQSSNDYAELQNRLDLRFLLTDE